MAKTILLVDDELDILHLLEFNLKAEGYTITTATDGDQALQIAAAHHPDLIVLDVMLPHKDGWEVIRELHKNPTTRDIPVIFLTARDSEIDEVVGLELGADDYVVKPISIRKFLARVKKALRSSTQKPIIKDVKIVIDRMVIDPTRYSVTVGDRKLCLTKKEFEILKFLAQRPGHVISREELLNHIWGENIVVIDRTVDVHIRKIREKLGSQHAHLIQTLKGVGYRFRSDE